MNNPIIQYNEMNAFDKNSLALCGITYATKMMTFFLNVTGFLSGFATFVAILAGTSTLIYNGIKIYSELKSKKQNHE